MVYFLMIFADSLFIPFFTAVFFLHFILPRRLRWVVLLIASYLFYGFLEVSFSVCLLVITIFVYLAGLWIGHGRIQRKWVLFTGLAFPLGALVYFKYTHFFLTILRDIFHSAPGVTPPVSFSIVMPVGISFYVFKAISYLLDVYHKKMPAERHFGYFALYISFFPQLLAGPIERSTAFLPELKREGRFQLDHLRAGLKLFIWGLFKKLVVADNLARFVGQAFSETGSQAGFSLLLGAIFFSFQIYCDFSGYSDIAIGLGRMLGYRTHVNFNYPYFSKNIGEFWSRWHISLSWWLRDYLFLPLAYSTMRKMEKFARFPLKLESQAYIWATMVTMLLAGLWHGANWTYVTWGGLIGVFLVLSFLTKKPRKNLVKMLWRNRAKPVLDGFRIVYTFFMITLAWIFFRAESVADALTYISRISLRMESKGMGGIIFYSVIVLVFMLAEKMVKDFKPGNWLSRIPSPIRLAGYALVVCIIIIFGADNSNEFLYFSF